MMTHTRIRLAMASFVLVAFTGCAGEEAIETPESEDTATTEQPTLAAVSMRIQQLTALKDDIEFRYGVLSVRLNQLYGQSSQLTLACPDTPDQCAKQLTLIAGEAKSLELQLHALAVQHAEVVAEIEGLKKSVERTMDSRFTYAQ